jgi:hypothetical protein
VASIVSGTTPSTDGGSFAWAHTGVGLLAIDTAVAGSDSRTVRCDHD